MANTINTVKDGPGLFARGIAQTLKDNLKLCSFVDKMDADAVLVTQVADLQTTGKVVNMNPQATYNFRPTYYYNVWSVDLQEYREPKAVDYEHKLSLATQMFSVQAEDVVWAIEAHSDIIEAFDDGRDYSVYVKEAKAIVSSLAKAGLIE